MSHSSEVEVEDKSWNWGGYSAIEYVTLSLIRWD